MKTPMPPPPLARVMDDLDSDAQRLLDLISRAGDDDEYLPWDKLRYKTPPEGLTHEQWWAGLKLRRRSNLRYLPLEMIAEPVNLNEAPLCGV